MSDHVQHCLTCSTGTAEISGSDFVKSTNSIQKMLLSIDILAVDALLLQHIGGRPWDEVFGHRF